MEEAWCDTRWMLADCLTKIEAEHVFLIEALTMGEWCPKRDQHSLRRKEILRVQRHARKEKKKEQEEKPSKDFKDTAFFAFYMRVGEAENPGHRSERRNSPSTSPPRSRSREVRLRE